MSRTVNGYQKVEDVKIVYYGAFMNLREKRALVVGGGAVATRKVKKLLEVGATVVVVSPDLTTELEKLAETHQITYLRDEYSSPMMQELQKVALVFAATNHRSVNAQVASDASALGIWCNIADDRSSCDFIVPAVVHYQGVQIAISTEGQKPSLAKMLREAVEQDLLDGGRRFYELLQELSP